MAKKRPKNRRTVGVNVDRLTTGMDHHGLTVADLAQRADVSVGTVNNALAGKPVYRPTATRIAEVIGTSLEVLLGQSTLQGASSAVHEYLVSDVLTDWVTASNGLKFQVCRMRHMELERLARGKRFDLRDLPTDEEQRCRTWIKRHPNVCDSLKDHPNVIRNLTAFHDPVESFYWVEWVDGESLQRRLARGEFSVESARQLMLDVAHGLSALHEKGIVRRELNPAAVLIRDGDGRAILTEFELSKLVDRGPTVSTSEWPVDPYRAGEAASDDVDERADIYSWARVSIHALLGELPEIGQEETALDGTTLPDSIRDVLLRASAVFRRDRPESFDDVISTIDRWSVT